jgi:hypothetical protein
MFVHLRSNEMPQAAVLLMDLQRDFLDQREGRLPVDEQGAQAVIRVANEVLSKRILAGTLPILMKNQFPATARIANFFRHGAAVCGTAGAELALRLVRSGLELVVTKSSPSAFSNPELEAYLRACGVHDLYRVRSNPSIERRSNGEAHGQALSRSATSRRHAENRHFHCSTGHGCRRYGKAHALRVRARNAALARG